LGKEVCWHAGGNFSVANKYSCVIIALWVSKLLQLSSKQKPALEQFNPIFELRNTTGKSYVLVGGRQPGTIGCSTS
jgi:hypothetical protein